MTCDLTFFYVIFFFKQKTAYEMRISDWSSDVCSSDLMARPVHARATGAPSVPLLFAMIFASQLALTIFLPAVPDIARDLDTSLTRTQWIIPAYLGAFALSQLLLGPLLDAVGRRPVLLARSAARTVREECSGPMRSGGMQTSHKKTILYKIYRIRCR